MRALKPLIVLLGVVATGPALAVPPDDALPAVTVLRGSSAPVERPSVTPAPLAYRDVVYLPAYYPVYYLAVPFRAPRRHLAVSAMAPPVGGTSPACR